MLRGGRPPTAGSLPPSRSVLAPLGERRGAAAGREGLADLGVPISSTATVRASAAAPSPRGSHSAVLIDDHVWVFGGYGGAGYQRHDFNDLYRLNVPAMAWAKVDLPTGSPAPAPRSGHVAVASRTKMLVHGGWSSAAQFNDLWAFDTEALAWTRVGASGPSRWNHAAVCGECPAHCFAAGTATCVQTHHSRPFYSLAAPAVPNWLMFVFGGSIAHAEGQEAGRAAVSADRKSVV